jgi:hypothetical protein
MKHLVKSFQEHLNQRGVTFYDEENCNFLAWGEVIKFVDSLPGQNSSDPFAEKLLDAMANYNPASEFLAVRQHGDSVSVELYSKLQ